MAQVTFYEKPGCGGNLRQREMLLAAGHVLAVRDLLTEPWTPESLRPFFGASPVASWFNPLAPAVRDRHIDPGSFDEPTALQALIDSPILIRRPLMQVGNERLCGFDPPQVHAWIGLAGNAAALPATEFEACAMPAGTRCEP